MIRVAAFMAGLCTTGAASQIFHMDLPEVLQMSDCVILSEVLSMEEHGYVGFIEAACSLRLLGVLSGTPAPDTCFDASYIMNLPRSQTLDDGTEVRESPLVSGSGLELGIEPGDTVIVLLSAADLGDGANFVVIRIEPSDSLSTVLDLLAEHD
jgi:hypothetical protein